MLHVRLDLSTPGSCVRGRQVRGHPATGGGLSLLPPSLPTPISGRLQALTASPPRFRRSPSHCASAGVVLLAASREAPGPAPHLAGCRPAAPHWGRMAVSSACCPSPLPSAGIPADFHCFPLGSDAFLTPSSCPFPACGPRPNSLGCTPCCLCVQTAALGSVHAAPPAAPQAGHLVAVPVVRAHSLSPALFPCEPSMVSKTDHSFPSTWHGADFSERG